MLTGQYFDVTGGFVVGFMVGNTKYRWFLMCSFAVLLNEIIDLHL